VIPGIDPRIDIAFKKVFGSESTRHLLTHFANAVLAGSPQIADLELMNPYSEQLVLDDKLSILDVKARDPQGRLYNLEMQMVATPLLAQRFLYYWSKVYGQQLGAGSSYRDLRATISICIVNGAMFPVAANCHHEFGLWTKDGELRLSNDLAIHIIELTKFRKDLAELTTPLDLWLYFLQNGNGLDADELPSRMNTPQIRQAMEVLQMLAQNDIERELYEGRLKAQRDMATLEAERERAEVERKRAEIELVAAIRDRDRARQDAHKIALIEKINLCERLLKQPLSGATELGIRSEWELEEFG
jgi:predicted transposase/invertase (TIGR01784 family)